MGVWKCYFRYWVRVKVVIYVQFVDIVLCDYIFEYRQDEILNNFGFRVYLQVIIIGVCIMWKFVSYMVWC